MKFVCQCDFLNCYVFFEYKKKFWKKNEKMGKKCICIFFKINIINGYIIIYKK